MLAPTHAIFFSVLLARVALALADGQNHPAQPLRLRLDRRRAQPFGSSPRVQERPTRSRHEPRGVPRKHAPGGARPDEGPHEVGSAKRASGAGQEQAHTDGTVGEVLGGASVAMQDQEEGGVDVSDSDEGDEGGGADAAVEGEGHAVEPNAQRDGWGGWNVWDFLDGPPSKHDPKRKPNTRNSSL